VFHDCHQDWNPREIFRRFSRLRNWKSARARLVLLMKPGEILKKWC